MPDITWFHCSTKCIVDLRWAAGCVEVREGLLAFRVVAIGIVFGRYLGVATEGDEIIGEEFQLPVIELLTVDAVTDEVGCAGELCEDQKEGDRGLNRGVRVVLWRWETAHTYKPMAKSTHNGSSFEGNFRYFRQWQDS